VRFANAQTDSRYETQHRGKRGLDVQSAKGESPRESPSTIARRQDCVS
jgi:hypothetical protein